jgi:hypothetical protein
MGMKTLAIVAALAASSLPEAAIAQASDGQADADQIELRPILSVRARAESVDQGALEATAATLRVRAGAEARRGPFSLLVEGEATLAPVRRYNAFPFPVQGEEQSRPAHAIVADPENVELNRLQLEYRHRGGAVTAGRQRIGLDDQRWVGSVGWRQNEQTFDALRAVAKVGPATIDATYAIGQRTIFGNDAGPRTALGGDFVFAGISAGKGAISGKLFAYLIDYDEPFAYANSSQTYGGFVAVAIPIDQRASASVRASYARQSDHGANPFDFAADYWSFEAAAKLAGFDLAAGMETLGADNGRGVQTPLATLHKFNGWADVFLTTPPGGLQDGYLSLGRKFPELSAIPGLNASIALHRFRSSDGGLRYGEELDLAVGARFQSIAALIKYARYEPRGFGVDTRTCDESELTLVVTCGDLFQTLAFEHLHPVLALKPDQAPPAQFGQHPAHGFLCQAQIVGDIQPAHRQVEALRHRTGDRLLALEEFEEEARQSLRGVLAAQQHYLALRGGQLVRRHAVQFALDRGVRFDEAVEGFAREPP